MANGRVRTCDRSGVRGADDVHHRPYQHRQQRTWARQHRRAHQTSAFRVTRRVTTAPGRLLPVRAARLRRCDPFRGRRDLHRTSALTWAGDHGERGGPGTSAHTRHGACRPTVHHSPPTDLLWTVNLASTCGGAASTPTLASACSPRDLFLPVHAGCRWRSPPRRTPPISERCRVRRSPAAGSEIVRCSVAEWTERCTTRQD